MSFLNAIMDALMSLLGRLPPAAALTCFSVLTGAFVLALFKLSSRPERIAAAGGEVVPWMAGDLLPWSFLGIQTLG